VASHWFETAVLRRVKKFVRQSNKKDATRLGGKEERKRRTYPPIVR